MAKICLVSSSGGHLLYTHSLQDWWSRHQRFWVTNQDTFCRSLLPKEKVIQGHFPENRHLANAIKNLSLAFKVLAAEKPDILFSTGAGIAPPFFLAAKTLGIKTIFMELFILTPKATVSGKIIYPLADVFLVQNKKLLRHYPKAKFYGSVL